MVRSFLLCMSFLGAVTSGVGAATLSGHSQSWSQSPTEGDSSAGIRIDSNTGLVFQGEGADARLLGSVSIRETESGSVVIITSVVDGRRVEVALPGYRNIRVDSVSYNSTAGGAATGGIITAAIILAPVGGLIVAGIFGLFGGSVVILGTC